MKKTRNRLSLNRREAVKMDKDKKELSFGKMLFRGAFIYNPVLTQAIGICSIVAIFTSLRLSLVMSLILSVILIINEVLASLILKKLSRWLRIAVYLLLSVALRIPGMIFIDKNFSETYASMGIYLPLLAVNSLIVIRCEKFAVKNDVKHSLYDAVAASLGFIAASVVVGAVREITASGSLWGRKITSLPTFSGMALPFGGLIVLGFLAAFHKWLIQKRFRGQPTNTFNLRTSLDDPVFHNEAFHSTSGALSFLRDPETIEEIEVDDSAETGGNEEQTSGVFGDDGKEGEEK